MGAPKRPEGEELHRRIQAFGDEWRAVAGSTERADRDRAERAINSLYAAAGKTAPTILWVPSPAAGISAYAFAVLTHGKLVNPWARGDIGNGENREFNGLADPFGIEPAWTTRVATKVRDRLPAAAQPMQTFGDPVLGAADRLGFVGSARIVSLLRSVLPTSGRPPVSEVAMDPAAVDAAAGVLGTAWPWLVDRVGADLARGVFAESIRRAASHILLSPTGRREAMQAMQPGQWDLRSPVLAASRDVLGGLIWRGTQNRSTREAQVEARLELARSAGPWWALDGLAILSERPLVLHRDDRGRPHAAAGPAVAWPDGFEIYAWHGVAVAPWIVRQPSLITIQKIDEEANVEVRRVLVERFGEERLIREGGAELVSRDEVGKLWRRHLDQPRPWGRVEEPVVMVEVLNSTPEPDGSRKTYFLRVPPRMRTPREAVAWTFGLGAVEYRPEAQS